MGSGEGEFDAWLETELARELGPLRNVAPNRARVQPRSRLGSPALGAGGTFAVKAAMGIAVAIFAVGATGTAMTGSPNPTAWGQAIEEVAISAVPLRSEQPSPNTPATASAQPSTPVSTVVVGSGARHEQRSESHPAASHHPEPAHSPVSTNRLKPTPKSEGTDNKQRESQQGDDARPGTGGSPAPSSGARTDSND